MSGAAPPGSIPGGEGFPASTAHGGARHSGRHWRAALLPTLLAVGSLAGIGAVMAGLLMYLTPPEETGPLAGPTPMIAQVAPVDAAGDPSRPNTPSGDPAGPAGAADPGAGPEVTVTATVGSGGPNAPLVEAAPSAGPPSPAAVPVTPLRKSAPTRIRIARIGVDAPLSSVGVEKNGEIEVPPLGTPHVAGWYRLGPAPGEMGPAVILGHVNTTRGPAVFSRLRELGRGDEITVVRADGSAAVFTVDGAEQASKNRFPTKRVYGHVDRPSLRLITCGGVFNPRAHSYTDNIIVYATLSASGTG